MTPTRIDERAVQLEKKLSRLAMPLWITAVYWQSTYFYVDADERSGVSERSAVQPNGEALAAAWSANPA